MFKRANKITALLVAAASVMSIVPAMAADSTRLGTKDGAIESAVAFDGKYIYEGYKGDSDKAVYFNDGSKDKELTDYEDYDFTANTYADKYVLAQDGTDEYLTDLTNGNITEDTLQDKEDSAASKLEKGLKKTDKYDGQLVADTDLNPVKASASFQDPWYSFTTTGTNAGNTIFTDGNGKYVDSSVLANIYAYSSEKGKVVKVDKFATKYSDTQLQVDILKQPEVIAQDKDNLYAMVQVGITDFTKQGTANPTNLKEKIDLTSAKYVDTTTAVAATKQKYTIDYTAGNTVIFGGNTYTSGGVGSINDVIADAQALFTDYSVAKSGTSSITIEAKTAGVVTPLTISGTGVTTTTTGAAATTVTAHPSFTVAGQPFTGYSNKADLTNAIISQFAGTHVGYTFNPTTLTFEETIPGSLNTAGIVGANLVVTAGTPGQSTGANVTTAWYLQKISKSQGDQDDKAYEPKDVTSYQVDNKSLYDNGDANDAYGWLINNGSVANFVNVEVKDGSLYAYKLEDSDTVQVFKLNLKQIKENPINKDTTEEFGTTKLDGYVVTKDGDADQDFENTNGNALSVDKDGILWVLNDGKIIKFAEKDKTTVYTTDSGFDQLNVYDGKNLVAWNYDDERYTTASEGTKQTQDESTAVAPVIVTGWVQAADGTWSFNDATGTKVTSKWVNLGGAWYFLKADGVMATGWYQDGATWYHLQSSGAMSTGWLNDNGTWYYLAGSGAMLSNTTVDGYVLGASGAWVK